MQLIKYIEAKRVVNRSLFEHNGIWWEEVRPGYLRPAVPYQVVARSASSLPRLRAPLGIVRRVPSQYQANGAWHLMTMNQSDIEKFSMASLASSRRKMVRKSLKINTFAPLASIDEYANDLVAIVKSVTSRVHRYRGFDSSYYDQHREDWLESQRRYHSYMEYWGGFHQGRLLAYYAIEVVGNSANFNASKVHSDGYGVRIVDGLRFTVIEHLRRHGIEETIHGGVDIGRPALNHFKESFGAKARYIPFERRAVFGTIPIPQWLNRRLGIRG